MKRLAKSVLIFASAIAFAVPAIAQLPFQNKNLSAEERAADLVGRLTLEEKASLMLFDSPAIERLGIPAYNWWNEALHGVARNDRATVYPMPVGRAASFDVSDEARVKYRLARTVENPDSYWYKGLTFWTPNINIFRDPRWGRGMETYGEDPYLTGLLGMAVVRGLQGDQSDGTMKAQACAKHFAVHSGPESTRHSFDADASERDLWETYLPAFKDLVTRAKVNEVMFAYNRVYGTPCGASEFLLQDILRKEWEFDGLIVSDCWAVSDFFGGHEWSATPEEAVAAAVHAGMNLECGDLAPLIPKAVRMGLMEEEDLDESVTKLLAVRYKLGEMDFESPWDSVPESVLCSVEHQLQALQMARESMVLLKNDGILPLSGNEKIALVGPNADDSSMMWGNYNGFPLRTVTLRSALKKRIPELKYVRGCSCAAEMDSMVTDPDAVVRELEGYETIIFAGGISPLLEGEELKDVTIPGFLGGDRTSILLPAVQKELVRKLADAGKKVIFVNFSGSAIALTDEAAICPAILQAWYPGQDGGTAVADVLFGDYNPSGRLPVTFYANDEQLPDFNDYAMAGRTYRFLKEAPLYPFGHGLSYTTFKYKRARVRKVSGGSRELVVKVKNTGRRDGDEVVQMYVSRPGDGEGPVKTLRGVARISLKAGKSAKVRIPLTDDTFVWWNPETRKMEPLAGEFILHVGGTSEDSALKRVRIAVK